MAPDAVLQKLVNSLKSVGNFEVRGLSVTEFSQVYRANEPKLHKNLVIKTMPLAQWGDRAAQVSTTVASERRALKSFDHPNIPRLMTAGELDGHLFWIYEFIDGIPLARTLEKKETFAALDLLDMARQLCAGVECAAKAGIVHHRFHPGNLIVEWDGCVKLLDWSVPPYPNTAQSVDSAFYLAPEQLSGNIGDQRSSLFTIANILYRLATANAPFTGDSIEQLKSSMAESKPKNPAILNPRIPEGISAPILKALSYDPIKRQNSVQEFVQEVENYKKFGVKNHLPATFISERPKPAPSNFRAPAPAPSGGLDFDNNWAPAVSSTPAAVAEPEPIPAQMAEESSKSETVYEEPKPAEVTPKKPIVPKVDWQKVASRSKQTGIATVRKIHSLYAALALAALFVGFLIWRMVVPYMIVPHDTEPPVAQQAQQEQPATPQIEPVQETQQDDQDDAVTVRDLTTGKPSLRKSKKLKTVAVPQVPIFGELSITSEPAGAQFQLDGRSDPSYVTPTTVGQLAPGRLTVTFSKTGFRTDSVSAEVSAGSRASVAIRLAPQGGTVSVVSNPIGASVYLDGQNTGKVTPAQFIVPHGAHSVALKLDGYLASNANITVADGGTHPVNANLIAMGRTMDIKIKKGLFNRNFGKGMARINLRTNPAGAVVLVNGQLAPKATPLEFALNPGGYELQIELRGYKTLKKVIVVEPDSRVDLDEVLQPGQ